MIQIVPGLADEPEAREPAKELAGHAHALLRQHQRFSVRQPVEVCPGAGIDMQLVAFQPRGRRGPAENVGVVMHHRDLHWRFARFSSLICEFSVQKS